MSQKQRQSRNDYVLIFNLVKDYQGMVDEVNEEYKKITEEK